MFGRKKRQPKFLWSSRRHQKYEIQGIKNKEKYPCSVTSQQYVWRRTQVTATLQKDIVNNNIRTPNSSNCDEQDDDGCRNSSAGYSCVVKLQCKWIQCSVCDRLHENCTILSKTWIWWEISKNFEGLDSHKEVRKGAISTQNNYVTLNILTLVASCTAPLPKFRNSY